MSLLIRGFESVQKVKVDPVYKTWMRESVEKTPTHEVIDVVT